MPELESKLAAVRDALTANQLSGVRLRGADWFAWATCGGSSVVDTSAERGVAEVLITDERAVVLADRIDGRRIADEERNPGFEMISTPWADGAEREETVTRLTEGRIVASDRPTAVEVALPESIVVCRRSLTPEEIERYRHLSIESAIAASEALREAQPGTTEAELAAFASGRLIVRGISPVVVLVGGERRLPLYRHPVPRAGERLGRRAMLVLCARRHGLIANLTRFVYFGAPPDDERRLNDAVLEVEAQVFAATRVGATLGEAFTQISTAYRELGFADAELDHHQGGLCGYRTRDEVATGASATEIVDHAALAWNPSLPGAKVEDTVVVDGDGIDILTVDPDWPAIERAGRRRPDVLVVD